MKRKIQALLMAVVMLLAYTLNLEINVQAEDTTNGFYIVGTTLYDANGNPFIMRGINHAYTWYKGQELAAIPAIANTGANTVRVVLSDGQKWTKDSLSSINNLIALCEQYKMIVVLEVHDATGSDDIAKLTNVVNYWIEMKSALIGKENTVILNIANEWYGSWQGSVWAEGYKKVIPMLRDAGIKNTIMVDCAGWGQYPQSIFDYGVEVFNSDTLKNTMFSIHMYEYAGGNATTIKSNIDNVLNLGLPLCIGEFGPKHTSGDVDEATIMSYCKEKEVGYLAWSWYGNSSNVSYLDLSTDMAGTSYTEAGNIIINGENGIKATSKICSVFNQDEPTTQVAAPTFSIQQGTSGTQSFGFNISYSGTLAAPTSFTLNGIPCEVN